MTLVFAENRAFLAALEGDVQSRRDKALCNHPSQAIADGFRVEVSKVAREAGIPTQFFSPAQSMTIT